MPYKVSQWIRAMELAEPDLKTLIEKQIISTAYQALGDFHNKILLSLPPEKKAQGPINLGTILYDKEKWQCGIPNNALMQNMGIRGRSVHGKHKTKFQLPRPLIE